MDKPSSSTAAPFARMPWYPRDFMSSTRGWPLVARAVYRELLDVQWDRGGSTSVGTLPEDQEELRGLAGATPAEWKIAWKYVEPKFPLSADGRRNERLEVHRQAAIRELQARRRGAEKTNAQRWGNGRSAIAQRVVSES